MCSSKSIISFYCLFWNQSWFLEAERCYQTMSILNKSFNVLMPVQVKPAWVRAAVKKVRSWSAAFRRCLGAWQTFSGKLWLAVSERSSFEDTKLFKEKWNLVSFEKSHPIILILFSPFAFYCCFKCFKTVSAIMLSKVSFQSQIHIFWHPKTATTEKKTCVDVTQSALSCHKCCLTSSR